MNDNSNRVPEVSIVILTYNGTHFLEDNLKSVKEHVDTENVEVIVIDNGTTKGTVKDITDKYEFAELIRFEQNRAYTKAYNTVVPRAKGRYLLIINDDIIFLEDSVKKVKEFSESKDENNIVGCKLLNPDGSHQLSIGRFDSIKYLIGVNLFLYKLFPRSKTFNKYYLHYDKSENPFETDFVKGCFVFMPREDYTGLGGFDERFRFYGDETDLCFRFKRQGGKVWYFPGTSVIHVGGGVTNKVPLFKYRYQTISKILIYRKMFSGPKYILALSIHLFGLFIRVPVYLFGGIFTFNVDLIKKSYFYFRQLFIYPDKKSI